METTIQQLEALIQNGYGNFGYEGAYKEYGEEYILLRPEGEGNDIRANSLERLIDKAYSILKEEEQI